jgi:hypothetical protein
MYVTPMIKYTNVVITFSIVPSNFLPCPTNSDISIRIPSSLIHHPDDGRYKNLWNVCLLQRDYTALSNKAVIILVIFRNCD